MYVQTVMVALEAAVFYNNDTSKTHLPSFVVCSCSFNYCFICYNMLPVNVIQAAIHVLPKRFSQCKQLLYTNVIC